MNSNADDKKSHIKSIKRQLEFYFSEGNLPRDEFMQNCLNSSSSGSVLFEDLLKFNKLKSLNVTKELMVEAVIKSTILILDQNSTGVKRKIELSKLKPPESRSIYICGFAVNNENTNADDVFKSLKKQFKVFGTILRLDLPKYASSEILRGFGFIEFMTKTAARAALTEFKSPDEAVRRRATWLYLSYTNKQYNHALRQLESLEGPNDKREKLFFEAVLGDSRREKLTQVTAVAKKEWQKFRSEFYRAQQNHLDQIREKIAILSVTQISECSHKQHEREKVAVQRINVAAERKEGDEVVLVPGTVVSFSLDDDMEKESSLPSKKQLRESVISWGDGLEYLDYQDYAREGFARFKTAVEATAWVADLGTTAGLTGAVLDGGELARYTAQVAQDKVRKREMQQRKVARKRTRAEANL